MLAGGLVVTDGGREADLDTIYVMCLMVLACALKPMSPNHAQECDLSFEARHGIIKICPSACWAHEAGHSMKCGICG